MCDHRRGAAVQPAGTESVDFSDCFANALAELPELTQTVVVLRLVEQLSGKEVKAILGCSGSEVSRRLHAGMDHLRERLAGAYPAVR